MQIEKIENYIREILSVPPYVPVNVTENGSVHRSNCDSELLETESSLSTRITVSEGKTASVFTLEKPLSEINREDILSLKEALDDEVSGSSFLKRGLVRLFGWWVIFAGSLTLFSVCPVCGNMGCPVGLGITGIVAGMLAFFKQYGRYLLSRISGIFFRTKE